MKGIEVTLINLVKTGKNPLNEDMFEEVETVVENVLVYPKLSDDVITSTSLTGKKLVYELAIPKGDTNNWTDCFVRFFGKTFKSVGYPIEGIEANVPTKWHKKVTVEYYG